MKDANGAVSNAATVTFNVAPVNDAPQFSAQVHEASFAPGGGAVAVVSGVVASDIDSVNYVGGSLTATVTGNVAMVTRCRSRASTSTTTLPAIS